LEFFALRVGWLSGVYFAAHRSAPAHAHRRTVVELAIDPLHRRSRAAPARAGARGRARRRRALRARDAHAPTARDVVRGVVVTALLRSIVALAPSVLLRT
jgi:hypothetical protein